MSEDGKDEDEIPDNNSKPPMPRAKNKRWG